MQLVVLQNEITKLKQQRENSLYTKNRALADLERAKKTLDDLTNRLQSVTESKRSAIEAIEEIRAKTKKMEVEKSNNVNGTGAWKQELDQTRKEYAIIISELDASKQELNRIRQDFDASLEGKIVAFQQAAEAQCQVKQHSERVRELSREIQAMQDSIEQLKTAATQTQNVQAKLVEERDSLLRSYTSSKEEIEKKLLDLREETDPDKIQNLKTKLEESTEEIEDLLEKMRKAHAQEMETLKVATAELNEATITLKDADHEENSLRNIMASLREEFEEVKRKQDELKQKEVQIESKSADLNAEMQKNKAEVEGKTVMLEKDLKEGEGMRLKIKQLSEETQNARREAQEMEQNATRLKQEAKNFRKAAEEAERKLPLVLAEAEEAKAAGKRAHDEMNVLSGKQEETYDSNPEKNGKVILSVQAFEALSKKVQEFDDMAEKKELDARVQLETINARKSEVDKKIEPNLKAIEEIKAATDMALKETEMAESVKSVVESELKWRQTEQNGVA